MLAAPMILGLASGACAEKNETRRMKNAKTLVAYLTQRNRPRGCGSGAPGWLRRCCSR